MPFDLVKTGRDRPRPVRAALEVPCWWIASDGNWYPPEAHPEAQAAPPHESGWWVASDGSWYPPEAETVSASEDPLGGFALLVAQSSAQRAIASAKRSRRRRTGVSLVVALAVIAAAIGLVVTSATGQGTVGSKRTVDRSLRRVWTNQSLHVVGTPFAADGKVVLLNLTPSNDLQLVGVDPANGWVTWKEPFSASGISPGVQFGPIVVGDVALDLDPAGNAQDPSVYLKGIDVRTGQVAWSLPQAVEATDAPNACNGDHDFCVAMWVTQSTTALIAIDAVDGQPVSSVQGPRRSISESAPGTADAGGMWQTDDSTPTFTFVDATGRQTWTKSVTGLFGGSQYGPGNGWDFALQDGLNVGSVGVAPDGSSIPLDQYKTLGISSTAGSVAWSVPGDFMCGGGLRFLASDVVCQYRGSADESGQSVAFTGGVTLRGLDPATGTLTWSRTVDHPEALSKGQDVVFADGTHLVVQVGSGSPMLLDTEDGALSPLGRSRAFWCEQTPSYKVNASTDGSADGQRTSAPVFTACSANGARVADQPTRAVSSVGVSADGNFIWPSSDGLDAARLPASR